MSLFLGTYQHKKEKKMSSSVYGNFMAMLSSVANEVLEETGSPQRFNAEGQPLRRTSAVDPQYHKDLSKRRYEASDKRAKLRVGSQSMIR